MFQVLSTSNTINRYKCSYSLHIVQVHPLLNVFKLPFTGMKAALPLTPSHRAVIV
jgi:hypothetical protein